LGLGTCFGGFPSAVLDGQDDRAHLDLVAWLDLDVGDAPGDRGGHFDGRFVGLSSTWLFALDGIADLDQHFASRAAGDILTQFRT
jgi:hypothetical protein